MMRRMLRAPSALQSLRGARAAPLWAAGSRCLCTVKDTSPEKPGVLSKEAITLTTAEADSFNRWSIMPRAFAIHIPTGAVYVWSMWQTPMAQSLGIFVPAASDWSAASVGTTFSCLAVGFGATVGLAGPWMAQAGPRYASLLGAGIFGGGYLLSAAGVAIHQLPLVWLGWGIAGGVGWGLGYISPISTLMAWFPDKKGLASGLGIGAFAGGGLFAAPMIQSLRTSFFRAPTFVGAPEVAETKVEEGVTYALHNGEWCEAILARASDIAKVPGADGLAEGLYLVGTGDNGLTGTLTTLGLLYGGMMTVGAWTMRLPPAGWTPPGSATAATAAAAEVGSVSAASAMKTPQFYLLWTTLAGMGSAGVGVIASAKYMMGDIMVGLHPTIVTAGFTTGFVSALSLANAGGRVGWAAVSDSIGCKNTMYALGFCLPACLAVPQITAMAVGTTATTPLWALYGTTFAIVTAYGGVLGVMPAYTAEVFGPKESSVIYGRLMTAWSATAIGTPTMLTYLKGSSKHVAIDELVAKVDAADFERTFGAPVADLETLVSANTVTISRLLEIAPPGTTDPSPFLYDTTFYSMAGIIGVASIANSMVTKVDAKHLMEAEELKGEKTEAS